MLRLYKSSNHPKAIQTPSSFPSLQILQTEVNTIPFQSENFPTYNMPEKTPMSQSDSSRIQSSQVSMYQALSEIGRHRGQVRGTNPSPIAG